MSDQTDITTSIVTNAQNAKSISVDGQSVTTQDIQSQIAAVKFLGSQSAVNSDSIGIGRRRNKPPGASGLHS